MSDPAGALGRGMATGLGFHRHKQAMRMNEAQEKRATEQHGLNLEMGRVRLDTERINQTIAQQNAELAKTKNGLAQIESFANGYGALVHASSNGLPVPQEAKDAVLAGLNYYLGGAVSDTGPAELDQRIADFSMTEKGGLGITLENTDRETGETYLAPMTTDRARGGKTAAVIAPNDAVGIAATIFKTAVEAGVDPRVISNAMRGGEQYVDEVNSRGVGGQRNVVTGKFVEGRMSTEEKLREQGALLAQREASADRAVSRAARARQAALEADLDFEEKNADRLADRDARKLARATQAKLRVHEMYPEIAEAEQAAAQAKTLAEKRKLYDEAVKSVGVSLAKADDPDARVMANNALADLAENLGIADHVAAPTRGMTQAQLDQIDADAQAQVDSALGMWAGDDELAQYGGSTTREEAYAWQAQKARDEAQAGMGMGAAQVESVIEPPPPVERGMVAEPVASDDEPAASAPAKAPAARGNLDHAALAQEMQALPIDWGDTPHKAQVYAGMKQKLAQIEQSGQALTADGKRQMISILRANQFTDKEIRAMGF